MWLDLVTSLLSRKKSEIKGKDILEKIWSTSHNTTEGISLKLFMNINAFNKLNPEMSNTQMFSQIFQAQSTLMPMAIGWQTFSFSSLNLTLDNWCLSNSLMVRRGPFSRLRVNRYFGNMVRSCWFKFTSLCQKSLSHSIPES